MSTTRHISVSPWWAEGLMLRGSLTIEQIIDKSADMGIDGIDMQEIYLGLSPNPDPERIAHLRRYAASRSLDVSSCWFYADTLGVAGIHSVDVAVSHITRYLAIGAQFGSRYVVIQNGEPAPGVGERQARAMLREIYDRIAPVAIDHNITIGFEAARSFSLFNSPQGALELVKQFGSPALTVVPDFEAWRIPTEGMPVSYVENPGAVQPEPLDLSVFTDCLPYAPFVHAKLLEFDSEGNDPNYPVDELMRAVREHDQPHDILVEYEGWLPDVHPERDAEQEARKGVELIRRLSLQSTVSA